MKEINVKLTIPTPGIEILNDETEGSQLWLTYSKESKKNYLVFAHGQQHAEQTVLMVLGHYYNLDDKAIEYLSNTVQLATV